MIYVADVLLVKTAKAKQYSYIAHFMCFAFDIANKLYLPFFLFFFFFFLRPNIM